MENKREFIKAMEKALLTDERSGVESITCSTNEYMECICIEYKGGHRDYINATYNSNGANAKEIVAQVYGDGAHGLINEEISQTEGEA